jgi:hypothetical protein
MTAFAVLSALILMLPPQTVQSVTVTYDGPRLILSAPLSDEIETVRITEHPAEFLVSLWGPSTPLYFGNKPTALSPTDIQVWLLKTDGTSVPHIPGVVTGVSQSTDNRGSLSVGYKFDRIAAGELAGVVVSFKGKLLVREIKSN